MRSKLQSLILDVEELLSDLRLEWENKEDYIHNTSAFQKIKITNDNVMCCCPYHNESRPSFGLSINPPYVFNCFTCGEKGTVEKLVADVIGLDNELQAMQYLMQHYLRQDTLNRSIGLESILNKNKKDSGLVKEDEIKSYMSKRHPYIEKRGLSNQTILKYEVGYDSSSKSITFPVRDFDGKPRFIMTRSVIGKYFYIPKGVKKTDILYGLYYLRKAKNKITEIFLNESAIDTMSCYENKLPASAVIGKFLFGEQIELLQRMGIKTVNLFFDNDRWGVDCALKAFYLFKNTPMRLNVVTYPGGQWGIDTIEDTAYKDANDLLRAGQLGNIEIVTYQSFYMKLYRGGMIVNGKNI